MAMKEGLIGRKKGMTQVFGDDGNRIAVTVVEAGPCPVVGVRTKASHGYDALQLGFGARQEEARDQGHGGSLQEGRRRDPDAGPQGDSAAEDGERGLRIKWGRF